MIDKLKVYRLAYVLYFKRAAWPTKLSCAFRLLKNRLFRVTAPISIMIGVTSRCQCRCVHCGMELSRTGPDDELSLDELRSVIREARALGLVEVTLFGGEPLMRDDLEEIIGCAREAGMLVSMDTNGLLLTPEKVGELKEAGLSAVKVSLDSHRADEHDEKRGSAGCFEKAVDGLRECVAQGLPCVISTYASREKIQSGDLAKLIALGREIKVDAVRIVDTTLSGCALSAPHKKLTCEDRPKLAKLQEPGFVFLENLASARALTHPICSAVAKRYIYLSPQGDVQPCCFVPVSFGSVRAEPLADILAKFWRSSLMTYDSHQCLMNNTEFRDRYVQSLEEAEKLPIEFKE